MWQEIIKNWEKLKSEITLTIILMIQSILKDLDPKKIKVDKNSNLYIYIYTYKNVTRNYGIKLNILLS